MFEAKLTSLRSDSLSGFIEIFRSTATWKGFVSLDGVNPVLLQSFQPVISQLVN